MNAWAFVLLHRFRALVRVLGYAVVITLLGGVVAARVGYARLAEGSLRAGRELDGLNDLVGNAKTVSLNATRFELSTAFTDESVGEVLDRFEALCREHPQLLVRALSDLPGSLLTKGGVAGSQAWRVGVLRKEEGQDGALTCYTDDRPLGVGTVLDRLRAFERTGDLAEFGHFHYVYVHRSGTQSHVRALWTEGEFNLKQMFPAHGDAAGTDSAVVPRPPRSSRTLAAVSADVPYAVHVYRSDEAEGDLRRFYDREMAARGWVRALDDRRGTVSYTKGLAMTLVTFATGGGGARLVALTETAGAGTPLGAQVRFQR